MSQSLHTVHESFEEQVANVTKLLEWDRLVIDKTIEVLESRQDSLEKVGIENARLLGEGAIQNLRSIRNSEALHQGYRLFHNQCIVLLVSYFSSAVHDLFNISVTRLLRANIPDKLRKKELKISYSDLHHRGFDLSADIGEIISKKSDMSFQDMQSIQRSFDEFFGIKFDRDSEINNIVTAQACRHSIAHNRGIVDSKMMSQIRDTANRTIQTDVTLKARIDFSPTEIDIAGNAMVGYCSRLIEALPDEVKDA